MALVVVAVVVGLWELTSRLNERKEIRAPLVPLAVGGAAMVVAGYVRGPEGLIVELAERPPGVRDVRETNMCRIHVAEDGRTGKVLVFAAIDNLWKGAAGQAVQDLNLMLGLPEGAGLA